MFDLKVWAFQIKSPIQKCVYRACCLLAGFQSQSKEKARVKSAPAWKHAKWPGPQGGLELLLAAEVETPNWLSSCLGKVAIWELIIMLGPKNAGTESLGTEEEVQCFRKGTKAHTLARRLHPRRTRE